MRIAGSMEEGTEGEGVEIEKARMVMILIMIIAAPNVCRSRTGCKVQCKPDIKYITKCQVKVKSFLN